MATPDSQVSGRVLEFLKMKQEVEFQKYNEPLAAARKEKERLQYEEDVAGARQAMEDDEEASRDRLQREETDLQLQEAASSFCGYERDDNEDVPDGEEGLMVGDFCNLSLLQRTGTETSVPNIVRNRAMQG